MDYLDTSAFAKLYLMEDGSGWMERRVWPSGPEPAATLVLTWLESTSALMRRAKGGSITAHEAAQGLSLLNREWQWRISKLTTTENVIREAHRLISQYALRAYDAVHLAAALDLNQRQIAGGFPSVVFISADQEQLRAAVAEGMVTENPNLHP